MKRTVISAIVLFLLAFSPPAFANESDKPPKRPALTFEQMKANILKHLNQREIRLKQEKECVQAAKDEEDLKACRKKFGPPGGPGGPRGRGNMGPAGDASPPGDQISQ